MQVWAKIVVAGLAALACTIAPIVSIDGATCGGFVYTVDRAITTTPNACGALIENLRVDRSLLLSASKAGLIETSALAVVGTNVLVVFMLVVHTLLVFFKKLTMVGADNRFLRGCVHLSSCQSVCGAILATLQQASAFCARLCGAPAWRPSKGR